MVRQMDGQTGDLHRRRRATEGTKGSRRGPEGAVHFPPATTAADSSLSGPRLFTRRVPTQPVGDVCAAFVAVLICRPPQRGWGGSTSSLRGTLQPTDPESTDAFRDHQILLDIYVGDVLQVYI